MIALWGKGCYTDAKGWCEMAGNAKQKRKLLVLADIFQRLTDEDHPLSSSQLLAELMKRDIVCERKSVYADIETLMSFGYDIVKMSSPKRGYFLASRPFELAEIRLLMDAVRSADFITMKKTRELLEKLRALLSDYQGQALMKQMYFEHANKCRNEEILYNIDLVNEAIVRKKKITFQYHKQRILENRAIESQNREFCLSPYALLWENNQYYLVGNYDKFDDLSHFRMDRISKMAVTGEDWRSFEEVCGYRGVFDVADYARKNFNMFSGKSEPVQFKCKNEFYEVVMDRFGQQSVVHVCEDGTFLIKAVVHVSDGLIRWLMQFGDVVEVVSPAALRESVAAKAKAILAHYQ